MFRPQDRERIRSQLLDKAARDDRIAAAAITGSGSVDGLDAWSDIDLAFGVSESADVAATIDEFTEIMRAEHHAVDTLDVARGPWLYRVFLLPSSLQVDLAFVGTSEFGARLPTFRLVFGEAHQIPQIAEPNARELIGYGWLYGLHARASIARGRAWQAVYMINLMRDQVLNLACLRHGLMARDGRGFDDLPPEMKGQLSETLPRSLSLRDLHAAFEATVISFIPEIDAVDGHLGHALEPVLLLLVRTAVLGATSEDALSETSVHTMPSS